MFEYHVAEFRLLRPQLILYQPTSLPYIMKTCHAVQRLLVGDTETDRQTGDMISLLSFLEIRLKMDVN
jgi:hypothetical protein